MTKPIARLPLLATAALLGVAAPAFAEPPPAAPAGGWEHVDLQPTMNGNMGARPGEGYQSTAMVSAAYSFIWIMVLLFVASVWLRSRRIERELAELKARIARGGAGTPGESPPR